MSSGAMAPPNKERLLTWRPTRTTRAGADLQSVRRRAREKNSTDDDARAPRPFDASGRGSSSFPISSIRPRRVPFFSLGLRPSMSTAMSWTTIKSSSLHRCMPPTSLFMALIACQTRLTVKMSASSISPRRSCLLRAHRSSRLGFEPLHIFKNSALSSSRSRVSIHSCKAKEACLEAEKNRFGRGRSVPCAPVVPEELKASALLLKPSICVKPLWYCLFDFSNFFCALHPRTECSYCLVHMPQTLRSTSEDQHNWRWREIAASYASNP
mmetsp:Transcript_522/g.1007  ORF Transcript_522/g.1007 Transcript_522/m.1007 type:complete len:268 (+) Transcript_522:251-1054(+)